MPLLICVECAEPKFIVPPFMADWLVNQDNHVYCYKCENYTDNRVE